MDILEKLENIENNLYEARDKWEEYKEKLKKHDWYYEMTSGPAYRKGRDQEKELKEMKKELAKEDPDLARFLWLDAMVKGTIPLTKEAEREYKQLKRKLDK